MGKIDDCGHDESALFVEGALPGHDSEMTCGLCLNAEIARLREENERLTAGLEESVSRISELTESRRVLRLRLNRAESRPSRFWSHVEIDPAEGACWVWAGSTREGRRSGPYGKFSVGGDGVMAHRFAYEMFYGEIPEDTIDHLCKNTLCVNPLHLESVSTKENILRGDSPSAVNSRKSACSVGHPYSENNTRIDARGRRHCRQCERQRWLDRKRRITTLEGKP